MELCRTELLKKLLSPDVTMSIFQLLGLAKCQPVYEAHTLPNIFNLQTKFTSAIQKYVDSYTQNDIDEHWFLLRDRYAGYDWSDAGLIKKFEDDANQLASRLYYGEMEDRIHGGYKYMRSIKAWKSSTISDFRSLEIKRDWPDAMNNKKTEFKGLLVDQAVFEISVQFKFLWIAGGLKDKKTRQLLSGLSLRSGR